MRQTIARLIKKNTMANRKNSKKYEITDFGLVLTGHGKKVVEKGTSIALNRPDGNEMAFMHAVLCQVGLPRSKVDGREFMRENGDAWLFIQAGYLDENSRRPVPQPIPYGPMPRLSLAWVSTYALQHKTREVPIGNSAAEFLRLLEIGDDGRRYAALRKQMHALAACRLQLGYKGRTYSGQPISQFDAWAKNKDTGEVVVWPGVMELSADYYETLTKGAVPLDKRALHALKGSALALDVYAWLAHRLHRIQGNAGVFLRWAVLHQQFGQEYTGRDGLWNFKRKFLEVLRLVLTVYPTAHVQVLPDGVVLFGSPPPVPYKGV